MSIFGVENMAFIVFIWEKITKVTWLKTVTIVVKSEIIFRKTLPVNFCCEIYLDLTICAFVQIVHSLLFNIFSDCRKIGAVSVLIWLEESLLAFGSSSETI
jgi:hypothetical protein